MRKIYRRLVAGVFAVLMLVTLFPFQVFAVDPVSAATMANALAQALTAYGASHGVSMMFDVSDTSEIGEGLHDLWGQFKSDINDNNVPTYDSLAVTLWTNLYTKVRDSVAINVSAENVGYFDQFWNWLLSGPAEMTRVDNQYYEWTVNQNNTVDPVTVYNNSYITCNGYSFFALPYSLKYTQQDNYLVQTLTAVSGNAYYISNNDGVYVISFASGAIVHNYIVLKNGTVDRDVDITLNQKNSYLYGGLYSGMNKGSFNVSVSDLPNYDSTFNINTFASSLTSDTQKVTASNDISVKPYVGDTVPQNVPIPDTDDPDYAPLPYVGPLGVSWIDNNFGDGETMTDAQREAIAGALDNAIDDDGTLTLEEDQTVPENPGGEVIGGPSAYTVPGLADVFPFCIPFDIYNFLTALVAEPTPPCFTATFAFPEAIGGTQYLELDFDTPEFNQLAELLRLLELLLFIIGLAFMTRSMFIRG